MIWKSDRLGIGFKTKTECPYRSSVKRMTHNAAALVAHLNAAEDMQPHLTGACLGLRGVRLRKAHREGKEAEHDGLPERTLGSVCGTWHLPSNNITMTVLLL